jgi:hypothetical protein
MRTIKNPVWEVASQGPRKWSICRHCSDLSLAMAEVTYFVALPFVAADDGIAAGEPTAVSFLTLAVEN